jgi:crossover junction endodeoxyribonuclease RuvC
VESLFSGYSLQPTAYSLADLEVTLRRLKRPQSLAELALPQRVGALPAKVRILGLDPGSQRTGYAIVETQAGRVAYIVSGGIRTRGDSLAERLQEIFAGVESLTSEFRPDEVAIERVFMHRNADSALKLGQARGAALSATFAVRPRVFEYAPREVKLAVVGTGGAQKEQVQVMVKRLLSISGPLTDDAADALAIALCHAHSRRLQGLVSLAASATR